jgi:hypothetical protein
LSKFEECVLFHLPQKLREISNIRVTTHFGLDPDVFNLLISHVDAERCSTINTFQRNVENQWGKNPSSMQEGVGVSP